MAGQLFALALPALTEFTSPRAWAFGLIGIHEYLRRLRGDSLVNQTRETLTSRLAKQLSSWVGACPGDDESAGVNYSHRSPKGNRNMRRILNQASNAAVKAKGTIFEIVYRRLIPRLRHSQTIGAIAHRLCRLIWKILHQGIRYEERSPTVSKKSKQARAARMIRELRSLGYCVELRSSQPTNPA